MRSIILLQVLAFCSHVVHGAFVITVNTDSLRSFVQDIRSTLLPNLVARVNRFKDDFAVSTQIGSCCGRGDVGAKASVALTDLRLNERTLTDPIMSTVASSSLSNGNEVAQINFQTRNMDISTKITSSIAVSLGLVASGSCTPTIRVFMKMPQFSFNINLVRQTLGGRSRSLNFFDIMNTTTAASSSSSIGSTSYEASIETVRIDPISVLLTVVDETDSLCNAALTPITNVINEAASILSERATSRFRTSIDEYLTTLFDSIPVAFDVPVPMDNGNLFIGMGLQSLQSTTSGILSVIGTSFTSTITAPEWRSNYIYDRAITDTSTVQSDIATAQSLLNNDRFVNVRLSFPPINNFLAAIWHQVWAGLATDDEVVGNMADFCSTDGSVVSDGTSQIDPCPFPPIRSNPVSAFDSFLLRILYFGNTNFKYQTAINPPLMELLSDDSEGVNSTALSRAVLRGKVPGKIVLRGTSNTAGSTERTLSLVSMDVVIEMNMPSYDRTTGIIQWEDNGLSIRIENAATQARFPIFGTTLTNIATRVVNRIIERRLLGPINNAIQFGLERLPIRIPSLRNLPLLNSNIDFTFPNFNMQFVENGMTAESDFSFDVTTPASSSVVLDETESGASIDTTSIIVSFAETVFASVPDDDDIIVFTTIYDEESDIDTSITKRVSSDLTIQDF